ncbi:outer membrane beta-barrel protein [Belliella pelovolcani]|uniref:Outer membrane protein beta-barrel domain-containing protein n=1 Tax=Belliella pelovolcani TaxID=529505 RepID=A0A1N7P721_9BACT|nr:outer membrane beta-barrel protein [Belliella pelovolcani]SIT06249.1 Outer membrane protein beta-barrel domain-containing protein [Belliella pelovolcani]
MKRLFLTFTMTMICIGVIMAQEQDTVGKEVVKSRDFRMFGEEWHYEKYEDKTWSLTTEGGAIDMEGKKKRRHERSLNLDLGINTWLENDAAPQVKPWGSWMVGINYQHQYKLGKNFSLNPAIGVNWFNFKFEDRNLIAQRGADGILFEQFEDGEGTKSKITSSYVNLSFIPTFHTANGKFRFGVGPYAGYRLGGRGKFVFEDESGSRNKTFDRNNMFANNYRYGARLALGVGGTDFFFNYDLNEYFQKDKGPRVNAISFGIIL